MNARIRLAAINEINEAKGEQYAARDKTKKTVEVITSFNLFQTPAVIAAKMAALLPDLEGKTILEPSAGLGRLIQAIPEQYHRQIIAVDVEAKCLEYLYNKYKVRIKQGDFLSMSFPVDIVIMNPPFKYKLDQKHINHAYNMLNPGGFLVAICSSNRPELKEMADTWEILPAGTFKAEGTMTEAALLTMRKG